MRRNTSKGVPNRHLREAREAHHWSQKEVAEHIGTTTNNVSRWELGQTVPGPYFRAKLSALFGKSAEELGWENPALQLPVTNEALSEETEPTNTPPVEESLMLWSVPYMRNPHFTGRDEMLEQLAQHLSPPGMDEPAATRRAALTQTQAIKGLGGIGKTQIAVEYAYRAREQGQYTHTIWINAANEETIMSSFVTLAELLPNFPAKSEPDQRKLTAAITRWLEQCHERWLLIFDNADDLTLIPHYFPHQGNGSILLTTRTHAVGTLAVALEVEKMGLMEGTHFLLRRTQRQCASDEEINRATNVVIALDGFPLALDQAGAYIEETGCSFEDYLQLYQQHRQILLTRRGRQSTNYPDSVATTWSLSFQKIEQANPAAAELLRLCAFLAPDHIPEELFKEGAAYCPPQLQQAATDLFAYNNMLEELLKFSLIKRHVEDHTLNIHRLVQAVQMDTMESEEQRAWAERVVRAVNATFPSNPKTEIASWPQCLRYLEQAQACDALIEQYQVLLPEAVELLDHVGIYLRLHASYTLAESLYQRALRIRKQQMGLEHPQVAHSLNNIAELYREQGRYPEAERLYQQALHITEQHLESDHLLRGAVLNGLASVSLQQGKFAEAEHLYQQALDIAEQHWGSVHPHVATTLTNLANLSLKQGKFADAEPLYIRALYIREQLLGPEHRSVASTLIGLANTYREQSKYALAEPLYHRALHIWEQQLGPEHPLVATAVINQANLYKDQRKYALAEPLYHRALHIWEQQFGLEHPDASYAFNNLAELYYEQGRFGEAEPLYRRAMYIREQQLGPEHHDVSYPLNGLANLYRELSQYEVAQPLYERALRIRQQSLGEQHIETAETLHDFAALRETQGKQEEAVSLYQQALTIREQVLGAQNPKTTETRERLHVVLQAIGRMEEAQSVGNEVG